MTRVYAVGEVMLEYTGDSTEPTGVAGDTFNTAVALAQLGIDCSYVSAVGDDEDSDRIIASTADWSLDSSLIQRVTDSSPGRYRVHLDARGERSFSYDRDTSAARRFFADSQWLGAVLAQLQRGQWVYLSGITLAVASAPCRELLKVLLREYRSDGGCVAFDCNHRPLLWKSREEACACYLKLLEQCDLFFAGEEDLAAAFELDRSVQQDWIETLTPSMSVLKRGARDLAIYGNRSWQMVPVDPVDAVIDTTGAGDIFNAGYLAARLRGGEPEAAALLGNRLALECLGQPGALLPLESWQQIREVLN